MAYRKGFVFMALLPGLMLIFPATVNSAFLPELPDWTSILMQGDGGIAYGANVAGAGDVNGDGFDDVIVTDWAYELVVGGITNDGAVWLYAGSADGFGVEATWMHEADYPGNHFGESVDTAGDVNGDGYADAVIGAPHYKEPGWPNERGAAYVFHGSPDGFSQEYDNFFTTTVDQPAAFFGESVAGVGDIDGDGYDDAAVGVGNYDPGDGIGRWAIFVYYGSADGLVDDPDIVVPDENAKALSIHVARAGDVNGDGHAELIVGDAYYMNTETQEGAAFVYTGSPDGIVTTPAWEVHSDQPHQSWFALQVAGAGDVNADGFDDVLVGAHGYVRAGLPEGAAFLYFGSPTGPSPEPDWAGYAWGYDADDPADGIYATGVAGAGDVDGDGYDDLVIGGDSYQSDPDAAWNGAVFVYRGSPTGPTDEPDWIGYAPDEHWGYLAFPSFAVAGAGDVNGDGHADILIGDYTYRIDDALGGGAAAYYGGPVDGDDDDDADDDGDDDTDDDGGDDDGGDDDAGADDDSVPDTNGSRGESLVQDDDGPCGC